MVGCDMPEMLRAVAVEMAPVDAVSLDEATEVLAAGVVRDDDVAAAQFIEL